MERTRYQVDRVDSLLRWFRRDADSRPAELPLQAPSSIVRGSGGVAPALVQFSNNRLPISPAAKWFLDNQCMIREQIQAARRELRRGHDKHLPGLGGAARSSLPRVYHLAHDLVTGADRKLDAGLVQRVVNDYQNHCVLTLSELWAVPAMLRLALIEKLVTLAADIHPKLGASEQASVRSAAGKDSESWVDDALIGKTMASLRALGLIDWKDFIESTSVVERHLLQDPAGVYGQMTFDSRSCYLDTVAILARGSSLAESHIAELAVEWHGGIPAPPASSASSPDLPYDAVQRHVGYYLRGRGRPILEQRIGYRPSLKESIRKFVGCRAKAIYLGGIVLVAIVGLALAAAAGRWAGVFDSARSVAHFFLFSAGCRRCHAFRRQFRRLALHPAHCTRAGDAARLCRRHSLRSSDPGGGPYDANQRTSRFYASPSTRAAVSGQSGQEPVVCLDHGFRRRQPFDVAWGCRSLERGS